MTERQKRTKRTLLLVGVAALAGAGLFAAVLLPPTTAGTLLLAALMFGFGCGLTHYIKEAH